MMLFPSKSKCELNLIFSCLASHKKICSWVLTEVNLVIFSAMSTLVFVFFMQVHAACPSASEQYPSCTPAAWLSGCVCQGGGLQLAAGGELQPGLAVPISRASVQRLLSPDLVAE